MKVMGNQFMNQEDPEPFKVVIFIDLLDIIFFIGLIITGSGLWLFNPAISLTVCGVIIMSIAYMKAGES